MRRARWCVIVVVVSTTSSFEVDIFFIDESYKKFSFFSNFYFVIFKIFQSLTMFVHSIFYVKLLTLKVIISFVCLLGSLKDLFKSFIRSFVIFSIEYFFFLFARVFVSFQRRFSTNEGEDLLSVFSVFLSFSLHIHKNKTVVVGSCARSYLLWWWWRWQRLRQCGRWIWWCYDAVWTQRVRFRTVGRQIGAACRGRWTK